MGKKPYGCLTIPGLVTAVLTALVVGAFGLARGGMLFSPGELNAKSGAELGGVSSHAGLSNNCSACHAAFWQKANMADRCVLCHTDVSAQLQEQTSLHGIIYKASPGLLCRKCHPDHQGAQAPLTVLQDFQFPHQATGYSLAAHQKRSDASSFTCRDCHVNGYTTFNQAICSNCHAQIKADFMQSHLKTYGDNCLGCHDGVDTYGHTFNHDTVAFKLTGKHVQVTCDKCHQNDHMLADLRATPTGCQGCHIKANPHSDRLGTDCGACHKTEGWSPAAFNHNLSAFRLFGMHVNAACESCHVNNIFKGTPTDCFSCHAKDDKHNGVFGTACGQCHLATGWLPSIFDHSLLTFQLTGKHVDVACNNCHLNNTFKGTPTTCVACHLKANPHSARLGNDCGGCHTTAGWSPATINHNLTAFPLTGMHVQVACSACHINNVFLGTPTSCYACHKKDDNHKGLFGTDCGACHRTSGWLPAFFNHTGFPLTGGHAGLSCTSCHSSGVFVGLSTACASCHNAPANHTGFGSNCASCHTINNWDFKHPNSCGEGGCTNHHGATCKDCHPASFTSYTCLKCHDSNHPD